jgi:transcriptional regulator with XRE-family HTH domain
LPPAAGRTHVEQIEMQQFARRLHQLMTQKGWSNSDLARQVWGETTDTKGYTVAKNRDRVGVYLRGEGLPEPATLEKIAGVFGITKEDLAPDLTAAAVDRDKPEIGFTMVQGHTDRVHLQINTIVSLSVASQIVALIEQAKSAAKQEASNNANSTKP